MSRSYYNIVPAYTRTGSIFGSRVHPITGMVRAHNGVDLPAPTGTSIFAAADGEVNFVGFNSGGYGYYVVIAHPDNANPTSYTLYAHQSVASPLVAGGVINAGDPVGLVGSTGGSTAPHLHYEERIVNGAGGGFRGATPVDPELDVFGFGIPAFMRSMTPEQRAAEFSREANVTYQVAFNSLLPVFIREATERYEAALSELQRETHCTREQAIAVLRSERGELQDLVDQGLSVSSLQQAANAPPSQYC